MSALKHTLTPADIMDLRGSTGLRSLGGGVDLGSPYILYLPADDAYCLMAYGGPQAKHADPRVLAACLRCERAERGFIRRVLSATEPCDVASLAPDARLAHAAHARAEQLKRDAYTASVRAEAARRASHLDVAKLTLDDLLD